MAKLIAKDNSPFYTGKTSDKTIGYQKSPYSEALMQMLDSVVPIPIDDKHYKDEDGQLAYPSYYDSLSKEWQPWRAGRYIGEVIINVPKNDKISKVNISIEPRFGKEFLFAMIDELFHFNLLRSDSSNSSPQKKGWNELMRLIMNHIWIHKFSNAIKYSLPRKTLKKSYRGVQVKGHINIRKSIKSYITTRQLVSEYREKEVDRLICSIVYRAYKILSSKGISNSSVPTHVQDALNILITSCKDQNFNISDHDYNTIVYKDIFRNWKPLVDFSWQIVKGKTLSTESSVGNGMCLFLDMAEIWEAYLRKVLGVTFADEGWEVLPQAECERKVYKGLFYGRTIIPDIVLRREYGNVTQYMVFDAKYKRMTGNKVDVDRGDFYQIHSYIQYYSSLPNSEVLVGGLLYPIHKGCDPELNWHSKNLFGDSSNNTVFLIDGLLMEDDMTQEELKNQVNKLAERIRAH